ncbi:MAG TPA: phosphatase PAP2 family protein [Dokdonella sp.]
MPIDLARVARIAREEARYGLEFLRRHWIAVALVFFGVLLPLAGFGMLVDEVREDEGFAFDVPLLQAAREMHGPRLDALFVAATLAGYQFGVVPVDIALVLGLGIARRLRAGLFAGLAIVGSALLNLAAKPVFGRERPSLWESIAPEDNYSFPSGHAMGSMTLACVLVLLAWRTRWRWPVLVAGAAFVVLVGMSRVYLGVHYPSDILAGWTAAVAWTVAMWLLVFHRGARGRGAPPVQRG